MPGGPVGQGARVDLHTFYYNERMDTRTKLTEAMAELLWERGYAATSPHEVMARSGVGQGSLYHHFSGKRDLAVQAFRNTAADMTSAPTPLDDDGSPLERLQRYLQVPRAGVRGCRVGRMTQDPQVVADAELMTVVASAFDTMLTRWERTIGEAVRAGELPAGTVPSDLARTLAAVIQGGYVLARAQGSQEPMDAAIRGAVSLLDAARVAASHD